MKKTQKILITLAVALALVGLVHAQMVPHGAGMFSSSGTSTITNIIGPVAGHVAIMSLSAGITNYGSVVLTRYPASQVTRCVVDTGVATNIPVEVDTSGNIQGRTLEATDWLIVSDSSTNACGKQLRDISALTAIATNTAGTIYRYVELTGGETVSCESNGTVFVIKSDDLITRTLRASINDQPYQGFGNLNMPYALKLAPTNVDAAQMSGFYEVW